VQVRASSVRVEESICVAGRAEVWYQRPVSTNHR
jgi:hypothetical protein